MEQTETMDEMVEDLGALFQKIRDLHVFSNFHTLGCSEFHVLLL